MKKSQASACPEGPRGTQTSAGRGGGGVVTIVGDPEREETKLLFDWGKSTVVLGDAVDHVTCRIVVTNPAPQMQERA